LAPRKYRETIDLYGQSFLLPCQLEGLKYSLAMITIPESDLVVHELCLGSNIFGGNATQEESHLVMDAYKSHGGNFIDTADMYNQWVEGHVGGES